MKGNIQTALSANMYAPQEAATKFCCQNKAWMHTANFMKKRNFPVTYVTKRSVLNIDASSTKWANTEMELLLFVGGNSNGQTLNTNIKENVMHAKRSRKAFKISLIIQNPSSDTARKRNLRYFV